MPRMGHPTSALIRDVPEDRVEKMLANGWTYFGLPIKHQDREALASDDDTSDPATEAQAEPEEEASPPAQAAKTTRSKSKE